jgi:hypothetical protein
MDWIHRDEARRMLVDSAATRLAGATSDDYARERRVMLREIGD